jgi:hypothetical protein
LKRHTGAPRADDVSSVSTGHAATVPHGVYDVSNAAADTNTSLSGQRWAR